MRKGMLSIGIMVLLLCSIANISEIYAIDLPYISLSEKKGDSNAINKEKSEDKTDHPAVKEIDLSQPLTLKQCVNIALSVSPSMKTAQISLDQEDLNVQDAKSNYYPKVDISGSYLFSNNIDFGWEKENYNSSIDASYIIWDHGQRKSSLAQAKARKSAENSRYRNTRQNLIFDVINAYYSLLEAEKLIIVDEQLLDLSNQNVEKIKAFIEKGWSTEADLATARVEQANNELAIINDRNNLDLARANLAIIMGLNPEALVNVIDDPDYEVYIKTGLMETEQALLEDMKAQSMTSRPELEELKANQEILELAAKLAKLERYPKVFADSQYDIMLDDYLRDRGSLGKYRNWQIGARVTFPLYDNGRSKRIVQKAKLALDKLSENKFDLEQNISLEVRQAYLNFERSKKSLEISAVQVEDAKMSLNVAQGRYETTQDIPLLQLLDFQARYARALANRVKTFYDYKIARRSLEKAMGVLQ